MQKSLKTYLHIAAYPFMVLLVHTILTVQGWYWAWDRIDNVMHFLGGMSIAASYHVIIRLLQHRKIIGTLPWSFLLFSTVSAVALTAVGWEFMEFVLDRSIGSRTQGNIIDTMSDLALGLSGALLVSLILLLKKK